MTAQKGKFTPLEIWNEVVPGNRRGDAERVASSVSTRSKSLTGFIVFEGIEGSGKTTQARMLADRLQKENHKVLLTKEPTDNLFFGKLARSVYRAESAHEAMKTEVARALEAEEYRRTKSNAGEAKRMHLARFEELAAKTKEHTHHDIVTLLQIIITLDRHEHLTEIIAPALDGGETVISDRYFPSTPAYAAADGLDWRPFLQLQHEVVGGDLLTPDIIFFIDIPPAIGLARTLEKQKGNKEYFDNEERLGRVRKAYHELFAELETDKKFNVVKLDGAQTVKELHNQIWKTINL